MLHSQIGNRKTEISALSLDPRRSSPSSLYRSGFWKLGLARLFPAQMLARVSRLAANAYWYLARSRRQVVIGNLQPALNDRAAAKRTARALFVEFALKLIDLWRYEAGLPISELFGESS